MFFFKIWEPDASREWDQVSHRYAVEVIWGNVVGSWLFCLQSWLCTKYTDDLVPLMEFTTEQFGQATREVFSGSVSQTEDIIDKHTKVMDKLEKKKKDVREIIGRGEKLAEMAKAPQFLGEKLAAMKKLWNDANNEAKQRLDDLKVIFVCLWFVFRVNFLPVRTMLAAGMPLLRSALSSRLKSQTVRSKLTMLRRWRQHSCQYLYLIPVSFAQLYDIAKAKEDHTERVNKASSIKADIAKTLDGVLDANNVLQVICLRLSNAWVTLE